MRRTWRSWPTCVTSNGLRANGAIAELLDRFDLVEAARKPAATYSGGMRRRLDLAMTLVGDPRIIFLDEPTTGLDPRSRRAVWRIVRDLVDDGVTIFLTTHYLEEADRARRPGRRARSRTADRRGHARRAQADRSPADSIRIEFADAQALGSAALAFAAAVRDDDALTLQIPSDGRTDSLHDVLDRLRDASLEAERVLVHSPDLDEVFLALTGSHEQEGGQG